MTKDDFMLWGLLPLRQLRPLLLRLRLQLMLRLQLPLRLRLQLPLRLRLQLLLRWDLVLARRKVRLLLLGRCSWHWQRCLWLLCCRCSW